MKLVFKITILVAFTLLVFSCTDDFEKINTDPNRITTPDIESLFLGSPVNTMMKFSGDNNFWIFGNYSGQISMAGGVYPTYGSDGREGNLWNDLYLKCINPLVTIETKVGADSTFNNRVAIARIWKAYIFSQMVAMWGPLPYFDACKGREYTPYDSESDIYLDLLKQLKDNADLLKVGGDSYGSGKEPVFNSDVNKWKKFAHSIRLRVASRLIDYEDTEVRDSAHSVLVQELSKPENLISSNSENCFMLFSDNERSFWNPFFVYTQIENTTAGGTYPVAHEQIMMYLIGYDDPRLSVFFDKVYFLRAYWEYRGRPSTTRMPEWDRQIIDNPHSNAQQDFYSYIRNEFGGRTARWMIISYPEIACIKAEVAYREIHGTRAEAKNLYYESIDAFKDRYITTVDPTALEDYKQHWGIKWFDGGEPYDFTTDTIARIDPRVNSRIPVSLYTDYLGISNCVISDFPEDNPLKTNGIQYNWEENANYKRIVLQHWMALFFQGIDSWTLIRRTQLLQFAPVWFPSDDTRTSYTQQWAYLPQRLPYPQQEERSNAAQTQRGINMLDDRVNSIQAKLKFAKPVIDFPEFPYSVTFR